MNWTWATTPDENCAQVRKRIVSNHLHIYDSRTTPRWCTFFIQTPSGHLHITSSFLVFVLTACFPPVLCTQSSWMSWMKHLHTVFFCFVLHAGHIHVVTVHSATVRLSLFSPLMTLAVQSHVLSFQHILSGTIERKKLKEEGKNEGTMWLVKKNNKWVRNRDDLCRGLLK